MVGGVIMLIKLTISFPVFSECHIHCNVSFLVLPAFNVTLTPKKTFLSLDDSELVVEISARFVLLHLNTPTNSLTCDILWSYLVSN